ncbi:hypothetical protein Mapa_004368 [Marchantia paleacea]|nr:hypothetical protein Mapa_004368 [Marchantia paleacea]
MEAVGRLCAAKLPLHRRVVSRGCDDARSGLCEICRVSDGSIVKRRSSSGRVSCKKAAPVEAFSPSQARPVGCRGQRTDALSCSSSSVKSVFSGRVQPQQEEDHHQDSATLDDGASQASEFHLEAGSGRGRTWVSTGAAAAFVTSLSLQGAVMLHAMASEAKNSAVNSDTLERAASRAPEWLAPAIFAFPVVSYFLFGIYRDQVNPNAKITDWLFGLVALGIVANIVMQVTWGVRLY